MQKQHLITKRIRKKAAGWNYYLDTVDALSLKHSKKSESWIAQETAVYFYLNVKINKEMLYGFIIFIKKKLWGGTAKKKIFITNVKQVNFASLLTTVVLHLSAI